MATPQQNIETALPFRFGAGGAVVMETSPDRQIQQHVRVLVATTPGERLMLPDYGTGAAGLVFETDTEMVAEHLNLSLREGLALWEPGVALHNVQPILNAGGTGIADVSVGFGRLDSAGISPAQSALTNRAVIEIGGEVTEIVRG